MIRMTPGTRLPSRYGRWLVVALAVQALLAATTLFIGGAADAVVAGRNGKIVFARVICHSDTKPCWELVVAHADGSHQKVIAGPYPRSVWDDHFIANWSPDGRRVIFMADLGGRQGIWQVGAYGHHLEKIFTAPRGTGLDDGPAFTPDGRHIIFTRCCPAVSGYALWEIRVNGSHLRMFTDDSVPPGVDGPSDNLPQVSPDGRYVVFHRNHDGADRITIARHPSGRFHEITPPTFDAQVPNWSPDGKRIVFEHEGSVWSVRPSGRHLKRLTFDSDNTASFAPSYAPSGRSIVFSRFTPRGNVDLYKMNPDGSRSRALTRTKATELWPQWAPRRGG